MNDTKLIPYSTAEHLASVFARCTTRLREIIIEQGKLTEEMRAAFFETSRYHFDIGLRVESESYSATEKDADRILESMRRYAWGILIEKMEVRRLMNTARQSELNKMISGESGEPIPDITAETIMGVLNGFLSSADTFLAESVREEYDFWKPHRETYKTNVKFSDGFTVLGRKIIKEWMLERGYGSGKFYLRHDRRAHCMTLDNIMHLLDGKGIIKGSNGPLVEAINSTVGVGETEYFRFKCFINSNLHLEFKRQDLLDKFNQIAGSNRLGNAAV